MVNHQPGLGSLIELPDLAWASDDEAIATVGSTGLVTAKAIGTTTLSVEAPGIDVAVRQTVAVTVREPLRVTTTFLPDGFKDVSYVRQTLQATGGLGDYSWALAPGSGPLPNGLDLLNGDLQGTRKVVGTSNFTVEVSSEDGQTDQQALSITVNPTPVLQPHELCSDFPPEAIATFEDAALGAVISAACPLYSHGGKRKGHPSSCPPNS